MQEACAMASPCTANISTSKAADFSGMEPSKSLYISAVQHKSFVEVDEKGTEAAAATAVVMMLKGVAMKPENPKIFKADHPFLFLIQHHGTGEVLFLGRVMDPAAK